MSRKRTEIDEKYKWNLTPLYASDEEWDADFRKLDDLLEKTCELRGKLGGSPEQLAEAYKRFDSLYRLLEKLYTLAHLKSDENIGDSGSMGRLNRIAAKFAEIQGASAWFEPEILALPEEALSGYLQSPVLGFYRRSLEELMRDKPHTLSAAEEKILGLASDALSTPSDTFSALSNADMKFPEIINADGKKMELTNGNYIKFLESEKREVRRNAFNAMYDTYGKYRNTLAATLAGAVKTHVLNARLRNFSGALDASLHGDNIPHAVYENLIEAVNNNLEYFYDYLEIRGKALKLDQLDMYDLHAPVIKGHSVSFSWEESAETVLAALSPLGEEYTDEATAGLQSRWVDVYESEGKRSGAYSGGCYDSFPYILMNFNGTLNDVFTLAHELGHSMHSLFSRKSQDYHYADYRIFVAEVASTTNELLLHHYLMKNTDDIKFKMYLLSHLADEIRGTVYRQTMFAEFEKLIHENFESGSPLTADSLSEAYFNLNRKYHGPGMAANERIAIEWARIPHFYYNFYVYKYATGFSAATALSRNLIKGGENGREAYLNFLRAGSTKDVLDILKDAGVDLTKPEPVNDALKLFADTATELGELLNTVLE